MGIMEFIEVCFHALSHFVYRDVAFEERIKSYHADYSAKGSLPSTAADYHLKKERTAVAAITTTITICNEKHRPATISVRTPRTAIYG